MQVMTRSALIFLVILATFAAEQPTIERAMQLVAASKLDEAESMLLEMEKTDPRNVEVEYRLGLVLYKLGKLDESRRRLESAAKLNPKQPLVLAALGLVHDSLAKTAALRNDAP